MITDKNYWKNELNPPYSPSESDVELYKENLINGTVLLLGCTHKLIPFSTNQMDHDPWYVSPTVIKEDWCNNQTFYDNILGDGVLNFTKDLTDKVLKMCQKNSKKFIARCFNYKLQNMRIANYFPSFSDFEIVPSKTTTFKEYSFYIWEFYG